MSRTDMTNVTTPGPPVPGGSVTQFSPDGVHWEDSVWSSNSSPATLTFINRHGSITPGFNSRGKLGINSLLPMNDFFYAKNVNSQHVGSYFWWTGTLSSGYQKQTRFGILGGYPGSGFVEAPSSLRDAVGRKVVSDVLNKAKDSHVNLGVVLAEREKTAQTVLDLVTRIAKAHKEVRRGNLFGAAKTLGLNRKSGIRPRNVGKSVSQDWLALQYGWKPLLADIYGAAEHLAQAVQKSPPYQKVVANGSWDWSDSEVVNSEKTRVYTDTGNRKIVIYFEISNAPLHTLAQLGITNPATIAWELVPFSFVVDWFLPIGNFISSLDGSLGLAFVAGSDTTFRKMKVLETVTFNRDAFPTFIARYGQSQASFEQVSVDRRRLLEFPSPRFPAFKSPVSSIHIANAIALIVSTRKK